MVGQSRQRHYLKTRFLPTFSRLIVASSRARHFRTKGGFDPSMEHRSSRASMRGVRKAAFVHWTNGLRSPSRARHLRTKEGFDPSMEHRSSRASYILGGNGFSHEVNVEASTIAAEGGVAKLSVAHVGCVSRTIADVGSVHGVVPSIDGDDRRYQAIRLSHGAWNAPCKADVGVRKAPANFATPPQRKEYTQRSFGPCSPTN